MTLSNNCHLLNNSLELVLYETPTKIRINTKGVTKYASSKKITAIAKELLKRGPILALGKIYPSPGGSQLFDSLGKSLYISTNENCPVNNYILILGVKNSSKEQIIYFTFSEDMAENKNVPIRDFTPSQTDKKIYAISFKEFQEKIIDLFPSN